MSLNQPPNNADIVQPSHRTTPQWANWFLKLYAIIQPGVTATITTAKLTPAGANGSMTFTNGILTAHTDAT